MDFQPLKNIFDILIEAGKKANDKPIIVGGFVRDLVYGKESDDIKDLDIIGKFGRTEFLAEEAGKIINQRPEIYSNTKTRALNVDGMQLEFQGNESIFDARSWLKEHGIETSFLNINLYGRDFTINSMGFDVETQQIYDPTGGTNDLLIDKVLRTPIDADITIQWEPIRIIRAIKMAIEYNLAIDDEVSNAIQKYSDMIMASIREKDNATFVKSVITKTFRLDPSQAEELYDFYDLNDKVPMPQDIGKKMEKSDLFGMEVVSPVSLNEGNEGQADDESIYLTVHPSELRSRANQEKVKHLLRKAVLVYDLTPSHKVYLADINENGKILFSSLKDFVDKMQGNWFVQAQSSPSDVHPEQSDAQAVMRRRVTERHQRRMEYRHRKRREEKRDRVDKIRTWRDISDVLAATGYDGDLIKTAAKNIMLKISQNEELDMENQSTRRWIWDTFKKVGLGGLVAFLGILGLRNAPAFIEAINFDDLEAEFGNSAYQQSYFPEAPDEPLVREEPNLEDYRINDATETSELEVADSEPESDVIQTLKIDIDPDALSKLPYESRRLLDTRINDPEFDNFYQASEIASSMFPNVSTEELLAIGERESRWSKRFWESGVGAKGYFGLMPKGAYAEAKQDAERGKQLFDEDSFPTFDEVIEDTTKQAIVAANYLENNKQRVARALLFKENFPKIKNYKSYSKNYGNIGFDNEDFYEIMDRREGEINRLATMMYNSSPYNIIQLIMKYGSADKIEKALMNGGEGHKGIVKYMKFVRDQALPMYSVIEGLS